MSRSRSLSVAIAAAIATTASLVVSPASAQEERESAAMAANRGLRFGLGPELLLPTDDGPMGGGLVLDGFKLVNDAHGHAKGDEVLRTMATAAHSVLRRGDVLARIGGDEFALMLVDASPEESHSAVERLRARFEELTAPLATSFSAGIAIADATSTAEDLVARADHAMYEEKRRRAAK